MATTATPTTTTVDRLSDALAEVFRTGHLGDVCTQDVFLDGHPPFWRFQLQGADEVGGWLAGQTSPSLEIEVVRVVPTATGFVAEHVLSEDSERGRVTARRLLLCVVRDDRIAEVTVYCSGDWDATLRARHAAEAPMVRP